MNNKVKNALFAFAVVAAMVVVTFVAVEPAVVEAGTSGGGTWYCPYGHNLCPR
jgi:TRAP-type uncharacterized transport system substrate-binding protein